jgi:hypothetical protein
MTKAQCLAAINGSGGGTSPVYGARLAWPVEKNIGKSEGGIGEFNNTTLVGPWSPTPEDNAANDYIKGGDQPPKR